MSDRRLQLVIAVLVPLVLVPLYIWYCEHPGGPWNKHVWMSEQIKPITPHPPLKPLPPTKALKSGAAVWGLNYVQEYDLNVPIVTYYIPLEIDMRSGDKTIVVKLDVCMKHGEWRVLP